MTTLHVLRVFSDEEGQPQRREQDADQFWAWEDEAAGVVRARVFAARYNVHVDEACGSASPRGITVFNPLVRPTLSAHLRSRTAPA